MGGIKNKLDKLSNKTLFKVPLWLKGDVRRKSDRGIVSGTNPLGSRLPSFSQPSEMLTRNISNTRTSNRWSLYASKTIGSLRLVTLTKYLAISCFTLAILSTLVLNIISSYSSSNIESNAIDSNSEVSTLANDSSTCDPTNTNAVACISLSITPLTTPTSSPCDTSNSNICMKIPDDGGIATGGHTVEVSSNNVAGYYVMLTGNAGPSATTSQAFIQSTTGTLANPTYLDKGQWGSWGIALPNSSLYAGFNTNEMDYSSTDQDVLHQTTWAAVPGKESDDSDKTIIKTTASSKKTDSYPIYYGVRVDSPVSVPADTYAAQVVYTATTNEVPMPTITSTSSNTYELGSGADSTVTIAGTNLASTYKVYIESNADSTKQYDITNTITNLTDTGLTVTIPTDQTNPDLEPGDYTIHVVTQGGEASIGFAYKEPTAWEKAVYMQDMTPEACGTVSNGESKQLIDKRDDKMYWVAKLADGNCWMTQNLNLSLSTRTALIPETSDVTNPWTPRSSTTTSISGYGPNDSDETGKSYATNRSYEGTYDSSNPESAHYLVGTYYQYSAATAGCDLSVGGCANSICPAGWHLPSREEFQLLIDSGLSRENFNQAPYFFLRGGYLYKTNVLEDAEWGDYWSSTMQRTESPGFAYHLEVDSGGASINIRVAWNGFSVRCVAD